MQVVGLARGTLYAVPCRGAGILIEALPTFKPDHDMTCHHCQRPVHPTLHGRDQAVVGYYRTVTGTGRVETHEDTRTGEVVRVLRVEQLFEFVTCRDCWSKPDVQAMLKESRRSGVLHPVA